MTYELVHGKTPFLAPSPELIHKKTLEGSIPINSSLSKEIKNFNSNCKTSVGKTQKFIKF